MARSSSEDHRPAERLRLDATKRKVFGWNSFVDLLVGGIPAVEALVWAVLYRHATDGVVTRSNALLARDVGVSDKTVRRAITALRRAKLLHVVQQGGMHVGASTYRLAVRNMKGSQLERADEGPAEAEARVPEAAAPGTEQGVEEGS